ncbi:MAG: phosphoribosyltransferase family protein [Patescibacteria group bacterium]|nr:phosphoribosyltransferase family protein [Patescibacteria group bacterium]
MKEALTELLKLINPLELWFLDFFRKTRDQLVVQPIPLHPNKLKKQGFNQAQIIGNYFAQLLALPVIDVLERVKETKLQAEIKDRRQQYLNLRGAFAVRRKSQTFLKEKQVILVDDIITTGHTVNEAAKILRKEGIQRVYCLTLAQD